MESVTFDSPDTTFAVPATTIQSPKLKGCGNVHSLYSTVMVSPGFAKISARDPVVPPTDTELN